MTILCSNGCHVYLTGQPRCTCGQAANAPKREEAEMYLNSWFCPDGKHTFTWTGSNHSTGQPSGYCQCGLAYYDAQEKRLTVTFPPNVTVNPNPFSGYHPVGYRQANPDPPLEVSLPQMKAAQDIATHLSPDGKFAYCERYGEVLQAEWDGAKYESWWPVVGGKMPEDAVRL